MLQSYRASGGVPRPDFSRSLGSFSASIRDPKTPGSLTNEKASPVSDDQAPRGKPDGFPTILVADCDAGWGDALAQTLEQEGYMVLKGRGQVEARCLVISHSRPIHVLLTEASSSGRILAATLKPYRREMQVLFVALQTKADFQDTQALESVPAKVRDLFKSQ